MQKNVPASIPSSAWTGPFFRPYSARAARPMENLRAHPASKGNTTASRSMIISVLRLLPVIIPNVP